MKEFIAIVGSFLLTVVGVAIGLFLAYVFGMILAITPGLSDALEVGPIVKKDFPTITTWLAIIGMFLKDTVKVSGSVENVKK